MIANQNLFKPVLEFHKAQFMGLLIFNIYVADLQKQLDCAAISILMTPPYDHPSKPDKLTSCIASMKLSMDKLQGWVNESNLVLNHSKMKFMLFSMSKLASYHDLNNRDINLRTGSIPIERGSSTFRDLH